MKYLGSKERISKEIVPIIQRCIDENDIHTYIEPMCGSCSVIEKIKCDKKIGYDLNKYLISLLDHVRQGLSLYDLVSKDLYDQARESWKTDNSLNEFEDWQIGNIGFLASYNGRFFDGGYAKPGYENNAKGVSRYRDYYKEAKNNLLTQSSQKGFKEIEFGVGDYRDLSLEIEENRYVVYVDPPYEGAKQYANSKTFDHKEFWEIMRIWSKKHIVLISELQAPEDFECIWEREVSRSIKANDKTRATEKLFKYIG